MQSDCQKVSYHQVFLSLPELYLTDSSLEVDSYSVLPASPAIPGIYVQSSPTTTDVHPCPALVHDSSVLRLNILSSLLGIRRAVL